MDDIEKQRIKDLEKHHASFCCAHPDQELRKRIVAGGSEQYVFQCLTCGWTVTQPIKKEKALQINGGEGFTLYDETLHEKWIAKKEREKARIEQAYNQKRTQKDTESYKNYSKYLKSNEWKRKREKVISRAGGLCEGCLENSAEVVHHLSYEHVGAEFLFELVALCQSCHDRLHEEADSK